MYVDLYIMMQLVERFNFFLYFYNGFVHFLQLSEYNCELFIAVEFFHALEDQVTWYILQLALEPRVTSKSDVQTRFLAFETCKTSSGY